MKTVEYLFKNKLDQFIKEIDPEFEKIKDNDRRILFMELNSVMRFFDEENIFEDSFILKLRKYFKKYFKNYIVGKNRNILFIERK